MKTAVGLLAFLIPLFGFSAEPAIQTFQLEKVRELNLKKSLEEGRGSFVSAGSGLVKKGDELFVAADDETALFSFKIADKEVNVASQMMPPLPADRNARAKTKPDFEALMHLDKEQWSPQGALVAWPSSSGVQRMKAIVLPFKADGGFEKPIEVNILPLAYMMTQEFKQDAKELNIEGLMARDGKIFFFQRGNSGKGKSGMFEMSLANWLKGMKNNEWGGKIKFSKIKVGKLNGVDLTLADGIWTEQGLLALASAEDTVSAFADGKVYGTVLLRITGNKAQILGKFDPIVKLEGIAIESENKDSLQLLFVDDADDPQKASSLYRVKLTTEELTHLKAKTK